MEIRHLEYFLEIARYRSFSHAAEAIHISQPTLSRTMIELENELGEPLLRRTRQDVTLTRFGEEFITQAQAVVHAFHNLIPSKQQAPNTFTGTVYIGIPPITAVTRFSSILGAFRRTYPRIQIRLLEQGPRALSKMLRNGLLDFGIFKPLDEQIYQWDWFEEDYHDVILPPDHPLKENAALTYDNLKNEPLLLYSGDYLLHDKILNAFQEKNIQPQITLETAQVDLMLHLVMGACGIAFLPHKLCEELYSYHIPVLGPPAGRRKADHASGSGIFEIPSAFPGSSGISEFFPGTNYIERKCFNPVYSENE